MTMWHLWQNQPQCQTLLLRKPGKTAVLLSECICVSRMQPYMPLYHVIKLRYGNRDPSWHTPVSPDLSASWETWESFGGVSPEATWWCSMFRSVRVTPLGQDYRKSQVSFH